MPLIHSAVQQREAAELSDGHPGQRADAVLRPGQRLSHYRLLEKIGEGGMGVVWKAEDTVLGRMVAVKFLPPALVADRAHRGMLLNEARLASSVAVANVVQVHEFGRDRDLDFIVMEYVQGVALDQEVKGRPVAPRRVAHLGCQIARALSSAHDQGLVHRDLKPANILVTAQDEVKVLDFGLAKLLQQADENLLSEAPTCDMGLHGQKEELCGTIAYMSPEQARREPVDARSDVFSLGAILYQLATGKLPFAAPTNLEVLQAVENASPRPVRQLAPAVPDELQRIIHKALARLPQDRYQHMDELAVDLRQLRLELEGRPEARGVPASPRQRVMPCRRLLQAAAVMLGVWAASWGSAPAPEHAAAASVLALHDSFAQPTWNPAGNLIAYVSSEAGSQDVWISDPSGANPMNLTADSPGQDSRPAWSPDGRRIAFYSERDGGGIFTMMVLGGDLRARLSLPSPPHSLRWSASGALIFEVADPDGGIRMYSLQADAVRPDCLTCS